MHDMLVRLYDLPDYGAHQQHLERVGVSVRRALAPEKHLVVEWVRRHFSEGWASETEVAFAREPAACYLAIENGEIIGFACHDAACRNFFGPTGVAESARGRGVGKVLLWRCLRAMAEQGYGYAIIGGVGPAEFYTASVGAVAIEGSDPGIYRGLLRRPKGGPS